MWRSLLLVCDQGQKREFMGFVQLEGFSGKLFMGLFSPGSLLLIDMLSSLG